MEEGVDDNRRFVITHINRISHMQTVVITPNIHEISQLQEKFYYGRQDSKVEIIHI
jgi:hypothetical protein